MNFQFNNELIKMSTIINKKMPNKIMIIKIFKLIISIIHLIAKTLLTRIIVKTIIYYNLNKILGRIAKILIAQINKNKIYLQLKKLKFKLNKTIQ